MKLELQKLADGTTLSAPELAQLQAQLGITVGIVPSSLWPIGSIFLSAVSTNPATLLGFGTWSLVSQGQALVGFKSGDADFGVLGATGGAKTVAAAGSVAAPVFTGNALAAHTHQVTAAGTNSTASVATVSGSKAGTSAGAFSTIGGSAPGSSFSVPAQTFTGSAVTSGNPSATLTPSGTNSAPAFTGSATSVIQPFLVVDVWQRTA